jgi:ribosomal protein S27E
MAEELVERPIELEAWPGGPRTRGVAVAAFPDTGSRVRAAAVALGVGVVLALIFVPIPIVHFAGVPLALLAGLVVGARRLAPGRRLRAVRGPCPHCGHEQSYFLGARWKRSGLPLKVSCEQCAKGLTAVEVGGAGVV